MKKKVKLHSLTKEMPYFIAETEHSCKLQTIPWPFKVNFYQICPSKKDISASVCFCNHKLCKPPRSGISQKTRKENKFELPTLDERKELIRHIWNELKIKYTEKNITELAEATKGTSHSFISKTLKEFTVLDKDRPLAIDFLFDECIIHCKQENIKI